MNILVVGDSPSQAEFKSKFRDLHPTVYKFSGDLSNDDLEKAQVVFDFTMEEWAHHRLYQDKKGFHLLVNSVKTSLQGLQRTYKWPALLAGFNGWPSLFDRPILELTLAPQVDKSVVDELCDRLKSPYVLVDDRVGMVTPRVICMIINEAFYTVQEGTASEPDIDAGMKLGTRYPRGPFEFCKAIGIKQVYELLDALYHDTHEGRYKICPLLKKQYYNADD